MVLLEQIYDTFIDINNNKVFHLKNKNAALAKENCVTSSGSLKPHAQNALYPTEFLQVKT
jgi:hypothetical protein